MSAPGDADPRGGAPDPLLVDELRGFRALLSPREADGNPILLYREGGEIEQTTRNLRAVLWDAAVKIEVYATALAASEADRAALERRVAELEGALRPFAALVGSGNLLAPSDDDRDNDDWFRHDGFALTVGDFRAAARALTPGASS